MKKEHVYTLKSISCIVRTLVSVASVVIHIGV